MVLAFRHARDPVRMPRPREKITLLSRRTLLKGLGWRPCCFVRRLSMDLRSCLAPRGPRRSRLRFSFSDIRLTPHYPAKSPLEDVLRLVHPARMNTSPRNMPSKLSRCFNSGAAPSGDRPHDLSALANLLDHAIEASSLAPAKETNAALRIRNRCREERDLALRRCSRT